MADIGNIGGSSESQKKYNIPEDEKISAPNAQRSKTKRVTPSSPPPSTALVQTVKSSKENPVITKPEGTPNPNAAVKYLNELIKQMGNTIVISPANIQALLTQFEQAGGKPLTPEQREKATEMWNSLTPEQRKQAFNDAIFTYAMTETGEFTNECKQYLKNPGSDIPTIEMKKAFSIFTLMIILSELSNFLNTVATKGMQVQQQFLEANFEKQLNNIWGKAWTELIGSVTSALVSGGLGFVSGYQGGRYTGSGMKWASASEGVGGTLQALTKFSTNIYFDRQSTQIEKEKSRVQFDQQSQKAMMDSASQMMDITIRAADAITQENIVSGLRSVIHNI